MYICMCMLFVYLIWPTLISMAWGFLQSSVYTSLQRPSNIGRQRSAVFLSVPSRSIFTGLWRGPRYSKDRA
jgi:hypothetical protein